MEKMVSKRKILITGNTGYIGPVLAKYLRKEGDDLFLIGFDNGYFSHCLTNSLYNPIFDYDKQYWGDIRKFPSEILEGVDSVIHLAAISNDPMGKSYEDVTNEINFESSIQFARMAKASGVKNFVFASSCSIYGFAEDGAKDEKSTLNPLTQYARSKVAMEEALREIAEDSFIVTALRFGTACGMSDRLRLDLVLNDFVAGAIVENKIEILSDGSPWRPLINVKDMSRAMNWALNRENGEDKFLAINTGSDSWNYQVIELAERVASLIPSTEIKVNTNAAPDKRSYKVNFDKFSNLAKNHTPIVDLDKTIEELAEGLSKMKFNDPNFRNSYFMRLKVLESLQDSKILNEDLAWTRNFLSSS